MIPLLRSHLDLAGHLGPDELAAAAIAVTWFNLMWYADSLQQAIPLIYLSFAMRFFTPWEHKSVLELFDVSRL